MNLEKTNLWTVPLTIYYKVHHSVNAVKISLKNTSFYSQDVRFPNTMTLAEVQEAILNDPKLQKLAELIRSQQWQLIMKMAENTTRDTLQLI